MAGLGGALLIASFFLPLLDTSTTDVGQEVFGVKDLRAEIEEVRGIEATRPFVEPALQQIELFSATPSLRRLSGLAAASREVVDAAVSFGVEDADQLRSFSTMLGAVRTSLWLLPLVGLAQLVAPLLTLLRGQAGFVGLVARFAFGLVFALLAALTLVMVPDGEWARVGPAMYVLLLGSLLMIAAGLFGVTRSNWVAVLAVDVVLMIGAVVGLVQIAEAVAP